MAADRGALSGAVEAVSPSARIERNWNSLLYLNLYRFMVATVLLWGSLLAPRWRMFGQDNPALFLVCALGYELLALLSMATITRRWPRFFWQLNFQIAGDILAITVMLAVSGGVRSGLGLLLIVSLASSALVTEGRMVMFYSALATSGILVSQAFSLWSGERGITDIGQAGLLGLVFFATAVVAWVLVDRSRMNEELAAARAIDLHNMAQINQLVIDDMQDGVVVLDGEGRVRQANQRAIELIGSVTDVRSGQPLALEQCVPLLSEYLEQWRRSQPLVFPVVALGGQGGLYQPRFIAVTNRRAMGAVLVLEDMTRAQEQAQQIKLAALGRLTANIAHEIRNPLAAITHASELMREMCDDAALDRLVQIMLNNGRRINDLINDVMALNRRDRMQVEQIELNRFMLEFVDEFRHTQQLADEVFDVQIPDSLLICFDRQHLRQVVTNLCLNAVRHGSRQAGSITIRAESVRSQMMLHIVDDGPGVAAEILPRLFEPFFTTESSGTGLGLYISRELCQANGASLEYVSAPTGGHFLITIQEGACQNEP